MELDASLLGSKKGKKDVPSPYALAVLPPAWMVVFHTIAFLTEAAGLGWSAYGQIQDKKHGEQAFPFGSMYVFLTVWNLTLNALFFLLSIVVSVSVCRELRDAAESRDWADRSAIDGANGTEQAQARSLSDGSPSLGFRQPSGQDMLGGLTSDYEDQAGVLGGGDSGSDMFGSYAGDSTFGSRAPGASGGLDSDDVFGYGAGGVVAPNPAFQAGGRKPTASAGRALAEVSASSYSAWPPSDGLGRPGRFLSGVTRTAMVVRDRVFGLAATVGVFVGIGYWGVLFPNPTYTQKFLQHPNEAGKSSIMHGAMLLFIMAELLLVRHRWAAQWWQGVGGAVAFAGLYLGWNVLTFEQNGIWPYPSVQAALWKNPGLAAGGYAAIMTLVAIFHLQLRCVSLAHWNALDAGTCCLCWPCRGAIRRVRPACWREPCCCMCGCLPCCSGNRVGVACFPSEDPFGDGVPKSSSLQRAGGRAERVAVAGGGGLEREVSRDVVTRMDGFVGGGATGRAGNVGGDYSFGGFTEAGSGKDAMGFGEGGPGGFSHYNGRAAEQEGRSRAREQKGIRAGDVGLEADQSFGFGAAGGGHAEDASGVRGGDYLAQDAFGGGAGGGGGGRAGTMFDRDASVGGASARAFLKTTDSSAAASAEPRLPEVSLGSRVARGVRRFADDDDDQSDSDNESEDGEPARRGFSGHQRAGPPSPDSPVSMPEDAARAAADQTGSSAAAAGVASSADPFGGGGASSDPFGGGGGLIGGGAGDGGFGGAGQDSDAYDAAAGGGIGGGLF